MVPFVFSILPSRKQQLVLSLLPPPSAPPPLLLLPSFSTPHSMFYPILSQSVPFPVEEAATLQSRSAVPSSPLLSSPLPSVRSFQTLLRISLAPASPRSLLGGERRGESGGGTTERRGNVYYVRDGAKSKMGRRSGRLPPAGERASDRTARDKREKRASSGRTNQPFFFPAKCRL